MTNRPSSAPPTEFDEALYDPGAIGRTPTDNDKSTALRSVLGHLLGVERRRQRDRERQGRDHQMEGGSLHRSSPVASVRRRSYSSSMAPRTASTNPTLPAALLPDSTLLSLSARLEFRGRGGCFDRTTVPYTVPSKDEFPGHAAPQVEGGG